MIKNIFLAILIAVSLSAYSQKSKSSKTGAKTAAKKTVLAKNAAFATELQEKNNGYKLYVLSGKDSLQLKTMSTAKPENLPADAKLTPFAAKGAKLLSVSWNEKYTTGDPKSKVEAITETHTQIWDVAAKTKLFENVQKVNNITEIVFLDPNNTASKTVDKIRREGFELSLTPEGDIILKNKTQQDKLGYDAAQKKFLPKK
jgi:hypothetical protein